MSIYAKGAAILLAILALAAFGWREYHQGYTAGQAAVQARWDRSTAAIDTATTAAVQQAASEALANTRAASAAAQAAEQHQAEQADFKKAIITRVKDYASQNENRIQAAGPSGAAGDSTCLLDAVGLRIWNDANAGRASGAAAGASDSTGQPAGAVQ